jgi:hypothetical protein
MQASGGGRSTWGVNRSRTRSHRPCHAITASASRGDSPTETRDKRKAVVVGAGVMRSVAASKKDISMKKEHSCRTLWMPGSTSSGKAGLVRGGL